MKDQILANSTSAIPKVSIFDAKTNMNQLPIKSVDKFQEFDNGLQQTEMRDSLKTLLNVIIFGEIKLSSCVDKMMQAVVNKTVEVAYSGTGKMLELLENLILVLRKLLVAWKVRN